MASTARIWKNHCIVCNGDMIKKISPYIKKLMFAHSLISNEVVVYFHFFEKKEYNYYKTLNNNKEGVEIVTIKNVSQKR